MKYYVRGTEFDTYTDHNQAILRDFARRNVITCVTDMVDELREAGVDGWQYEDFENNAYEACSVCGGRVHALDLNNPAEVEAFDTYCNTVGIDPDSIDFDDYRICDDGHVMEASETVEEYPYVLNYYIVTPGLGEGLREAGEMVLPRCEGWIWGRTTSGEGEYMDEAVTRAAVYNFEILEGQRFEEKPARW